MSVMIEGRQLFMAGRHSSVADVVWNALGGWVGALLWRALVMRLLSPTPWAVLLPAGFVSSLLIIGGLLLTPSHTDGEYVGLWPPSRGASGRYSGQVVRASLSGQPFPYGKLPDGPPHKTWFEDDWELRGEVIAGRPPRRVSSVLSVYDKMGREILLLGAHRADLVYRERTRGEVLRFDSPDIRLLDGLTGVEVGDTISVTAGRDRELCLGINDTKQCGLGVTPGRTWGLLLYLEGPYEAYRRVLDFFWLVLLFCPVGFWAVGRRGWGWGIGMSLSGSSIAVAATPLILPGPLELVAVFVGLVSGSAAAELVRGLMPGVDA